MNEIDRDVLKKLADEIVFGPIRHGEMRPFAMKKLTEAFEAGARSKEQPCPTTESLPSQSS